MDFFAGYFIEWNRVGDKIAGVRGKVTGIINQHTAMTEVDDVAIKGLFVQANKHISIVAHGLDRLIANTYLKQTRSTKDFSWEGTEGIDMIPPAGSTQSDKITT